MKEELKEIKLYTLQELVPVLDVTYRTLLDYVKTGRLKAVKIGGRWRISSENLQAFLNGQ
jgi:excisionase family DNA binding protein